MPSTCPKERARSSSAIIDPRYQEVVGRLEESLTIGWDLGASLYVELDGKPVIDVVGGYTDPPPTLSTNNKNRRRQFSHNDVNLIMSNGKSLETIGIAILVERALLDITIPIATYWPEFAQNGKQNVTLQDILSHRAGNCCFETEPSLEILQDDKKRDDFLASQPFLYPIGTVIYRGWTSSFYSDAICRRVDPLQRNLHEFIQQEVFDPLNETLICPPIDNNDDDDNQQFQQQKKKVQVNQVYGISTARLLLGIVPQLFLPRWVFTTMFRGGMDERMILNPEQVEILQTALMKQDPNFPLLKPSIPNPPETPDDFNNRNGFLSYPMLSGNCMANARGATRALASFFDDDNNNKNKLVSKKTRDLFLQPLPPAKDGLLLTKYNHTSGGFAINLFQRPETIGCIGWFGMGGSTLQYCTIPPILGNNTNTNSNNSHTVAFGYVPNAFSPKLFVDRASTLISAVANVTIMLGDGL